MLNNISHIYKLLTKPFHFISTLFPQGANVGLLGGMGFGGTFAAFQIATKALCVFGIPGAVAGGALGLVGGCVVGGMAGGLPFATVEAMFRKYAEKFKILDDTLTKIDKVLLENFEVLTEICRLLGRLKIVAKGISEAPEVKSNVAVKDQVDDKAPPPGGDDDTNLDFLIQLRFDSFKRASQELEKNCDYLLDDIPLKALGLLSLDGIDNDKVTKETKKLD